jgi:hypothetical protein
MLHRCASCPERQRVERLQGLLVLDCIAECFCQNCWFGSCHSVGSTLASLLRCRCVQRDFAVKEDVVLLVSSPQALQTCVCAPRKACEVHMTRSSLRPLQDGWMQLCFVTGMWCYPCSGPGPTWCRDQDCPVAGVEKKCLDSLAGQTSVSVELRQL